MIRCEAWHVVAATHVSSDAVASSRPAFPIQPRTPSKMYSVKEIFFTIQGEGAHTGRAAVFCRFSGCNLWTGREADRSNAVCSFCDTDFIGIADDGGRFATADELADAIASHWSSGTDGEPFVVCTGGEPLLQLDQ